MIKEVIEDIKAKKAAEVAERKKQEALAKKRANEEAERKKVRAFQDEQFSTSSLFVLDKLCKAKEDVPRVGTITYEYWEHECFYSDDPEDVLSSRVGKKGYMKQISHNYGEPDVEIPYKVVEGPVEKYEIGEGYNCNEIRVRSVDSNGDYKVYSTLMFSLPWKKRPFTLSVTGYAADGPDILHNVSRENIKRIIDRQNSANKKEARQNAILAIGNKRNNFYVNNEGANPENF